MPQPNSPFTIYHSPFRRAFSLLELLVVIAIIAILLALISPAIERAVERSRLVVCGENLHSLSVALHAYASEFNDALPLGPATASIPDPSRPWNRLGDSTAWIGPTSQYNGLGILSKDWCKNPKAFNCPFDDDKSFATAFQQNLGTPGATAYASYIYRQLQQTTNDRLANLGTNDANLPAKALLIDWQSLGPPPYHHTSHDNNEYVNILFNDGHVQSAPNHPDDYILRPTDYTPFPAAFTQRLDQLWIKADAAN